MSTRVKQATAAGRDFVILRFKSRPYGEFSIKARYKDGRFRVIGVQREYTHALGEMLRQLAQRLKSRFAEEIARDPSGFKKRVVRLIRRELPPRPGRPNDPRLDAAVRLVEQGKSTRDVLRSQVPDFDEMDSYGRYLAEKGLRAALARRRRVRSRPRGHGNLGD